MKTTFLLRLTEDLKQWCDDTAKNLGVTTTGLIIYILQTYRETYNKENKTPNSKE